MVYKATLYIQTELCSKASRITMGLSVVIRAVRVREGESVCPYHGVGVLGGVPHARKTEKERERKRKKEKERERKRKKEKEREQD